MENIVLPWKERHWQLSITYCNSTTDISARIFGEQYNDRFQELMSRIFLFMESKKERPLSVASKNIYLIYHSQFWHRVYVEKLNKSNATARVSFIDFGGSSWMDIRELYFCEPEFLQVPAQAVRFSLFGLEDLAKHPRALRYLRDLLQDKCFIGEILSKESPYYNTNPKASDRVSVVLFNTTTTEDIIMNEILLDKICNDTLLPTLKNKRLTEVLVPHVNLKGFVYLQILNEDFKYIKSLLEELAETKFKNQIVRKDLEKSRLYLICDDTNSSEPQWYRAELNEMPQNEDDKNIDMYCVDHGFRRDTKISNIFYLEAFSKVLSKLPRQAVKARLNNVPLINDKIISRFQEVMPANCKAFVEINQPDDDPFVTIYRQIEKPDMICNINELLRVEEELESFENDSTEFESKSNSSASLKAEDEKPLVECTKETLPPVSTSKIYRDIRLGVTICTPIHQIEAGKLKVYDDLPFNDKVLSEVRVSISTDPSNFIVQPYREYLALCKVMDDLQEHCENNDEFIPPDMVKEGQAYAAKNSDGFYNRVIVTSTSENNEIGVVFCDSGDVGTLNSDQLKLLPAKYHRFPKLALKAKLYGIIARNGKWTDDDCVRFRELTLGQKFMATTNCVTYENINAPEPVILELELHNRIQTGDICINEIMIAENRAVRMSTAMPWNKKTF